MSLSRPVRPRHAASLVLVRRSASGVEVLMGRRPPKAVFPEAYVFPGGRLDPSDAAVAPSTHLAPDVLESLRAHGACTPQLARGLANAAIRETFEETGLLLAAPGDTGTPHGPWAAFKAQGIAPAHDRLRFLGRAITPASAPVRFHARFFVADGEHVEGVITGNGELSNIAWYRLDDARGLPAIDVTQFVLAEIAANERGQTRTAPFFRYRRNRVLAKSADA
jgi:8-oxo-dGTP pyrophosphatase MutT (NUDIX family)